MRIHSCLCAGLLATVTLLTGCLKCELTLTLKENNGGALDVSYSIAEQSITQIKAMETLRQQMAKLTPDAAAPEPEIMLFLDPSEDAIRKKLERYSAQGIYMEKLKVQSRNARRYVELRLTYEDLAKAAKADFFSSQGFSLIRREDGNYLLQRQRQSANPSSSDVFSDPQALKVITPILEGFRFLVKTEVPGKIITANTEEKGLKTALWTFDFDQNPKSFSALQQQDFMVLFEGKGLNLTTVKIVSKDAVPPAKSETKK